MGKRVRFRSRKRRRSRRTSRRRTKKRTKRRRRSRSRLADKRINTLVEKRMQEVSKREIAKAHKKDYKVVRGLYQDPQAPLWSTTWNTDEWPALTTFDTLLSNQFYVREIGKCGGYLDTDLKETKESIQYKATTTLLLLLLLNKRG